MPGFVRLTLHTSHLTLRRSRLPASLRTGRTLRGNCAKQTQFPETPTLVSRRPVVYRRAAAQRLTAGRLRPILPNKANSWLTACRTTDYVPGERLEPLFRRQCGARGCKMVNRIDRESPARRQADQSYMGAMSTALRRHAGFGGETGTRRYLSRLEPEHAYASVGMAPLQQDLARSEYGQG